MRCIAGSVDVQPCAGVADDPAADRDAAAERVGGEHHRKLHRRTRQLQGSLHSQLDIQGVVRAGLLV